MPGKGSLKNEIALRPEGQSGRGGGEGPGGRYVLAATT